ncbi:MAG: ribonuclease E/G [Muribaculaceae bacterium]|nr:ribonuclease E/G [Muribaculaceae bacterium]
MQDKPKGKILFLELYHKLFSILICERQILAIQADTLLPEQTECQIGNLYVGRVQNIAANIGAAFVEIQKGVLTFLSLAEAKNAILTNRESDGTLKIGDELLVQVTKKPVKTKLATVSTRLSLAGSYVVIEYRNPGIDKGITDSSLQGKGIKISSRLGARYHHLYQDLEPLLEIAQHFDVTVRTNAGNVEDTSIVTKEAQTLATKLTHILEIGRTRIRFSCLYESEPPYLAFLKNCYQSEYDEIITDKKDLYEQLTSGQLSPVPIRYYEDSRLPLYKLYSIETRIQELLGKKVWLKSGAYLIIEQTEALIAIDVNTGKYESHKNQEETYFKINLEAAEAIAISLRARNLSGMILVDFINMKTPEHTARLTEYMKSLLKKDSVSAYVVDITGLGLMEITRQKKNKSFAEQMRQGADSASERKAEKP